MKRWMGCLSLAVCALLVACGGGSDCSLLAGGAACKSSSGGSGSGQDQPNTPITPPPSVVPEASALAVQGTAAEGLAIASAPVNMVCVQGAGQAVTDANGRFTVAVTQARPPCLLEVTSTVTGQRYHGLLLSGTRANITPVTELISAATLGEQPTQLFNAANPAQRASRLSALTEAGLTAATARVLALSQAIAGAELSSAVDYLKGAFTAATSNVPGDATDRKLDALVAALEASGQSQFSINQALIDASASSVGQAVKTLLGSAADSLPDCPAARSGEYWMLMSNGFGFYFAQGQVTQALSATLDGANRRAYRRYLDGDVKVEALDFIRRYKDGVLQPCLFDVGTGQGELMEVRFTANGIGLLSNRSSAVGVMLPRQKQTGVVGLANRTFRVLQFGQVNGEAADFNYAPGFRQWVFANDGQRLGNYNCGLGSNGRVQCAATADRQLSVQLRSDGAYEFREANGTPTLGVLWRYRDQTLLWLSLRNGSTLDPVGMGVGMSGGSCAAPALGVTHELSSYAITHAGSTRTVAASSSWLQASSYNASSGVVQLAVLPTATSTVPEDYLFDNWMTMGECTAYRASDGVLSRVQPRLMMNIGRDMQVAVSTDYSAQRGTRLWLSQRSIKE